MLLRKFGRGREFEGVKNIKLTCIELKKKLVQVSKVSNPVSVAELCLRYVSVTS